MGSGQVFEARGELVEPSAVSLSSRTSARGELRDFRLIPPHHGFFLLPTPALDLALTGQSLFTGTERFAIE